MNTISWVKALFFVAVSLTGPSSICALSPCEEEIVIRLLDAGYNLEEINEFFAAFDEKQPQADQENRIGICIHPAEGLTDEEMQRAQEIAEHALSISGNEMKALDQVRRAFPDTEFGMDWFRGYNSGSIEGHASWNETGGAVY